MGGIATYVIEHGLHESDGDLGLLHEIILRILDFKTSMLLFGGCGILQAIKSQVVSINMGSGRESYIRLLSRIQFQAANPNGLPSFHGDSNAGGQSRLPRRQEVVLNCRVVSLPRGSNLLPSLGVLSERPAEFVFGAESVSGGGSGTTQCMRKSLVLSGQRRRWSGCRKVCALEVGSSEGSEIVADCGTEFRDRLLNLCGVVVRLCFVDLGDPG